MGIEPTTDTSPCPSLDLKSRGPTRDRPLPRSIIILRLTEVVNRENHFSTKGRVLYGS